MDNGQCNKQKTNGKMKHGKVPEKRTELHVMHTASHTTEKDGRWCIQIVGASMALACPNGRAKKNEKTKKTKKRKKEKKRKAHHRTACNAHCVSTTEKERTVPRIWIVAAHQCSMSRWRASSDRKKNAMRDRQKRRSGWSREPGWRTKARYTHKKARARCRSVCTGG